MESRFDLPAPHGTCYLARDEVAALLEAIAQEFDGAVSSAFLDARRIRTLHVPSDRRLANLSSRRAVGFGVTSEIHAMTPYTKPQAWARALHAAGFQGLSYSVRHDPSPRDDGIALFDRQGERRSWPRGSALQIDLRLRERLTTECGIRVLKIPRAEQLSYGSEYPSR